VQPQAVQSEQQVGQPGPLADQRADSPASDNSQKLGNSNEQDGEDNEKVYEDKDDEDNKEAASDLANKLDEDENGQNGVRAPTGDDQIPASAVNEREEDNEEEEEEDKVFNRERA